MKVLVGSPVSKHHTYCTPQYLEAIKNLSYKDYDILLVDNSEDDKWYKEIKNSVPIVRYGYEHESVKTRMVACRNYLRDYTLKNGYDYFLDLDQDVIPPKDIIERMLAHKKDFVTGIYFNYFEKTRGKLERTPVAYAWFRKNDIEEILKSPDTLKQTNPNLYSALLKTNWDFSKLMRPLSEQEIKDKKLLKIRACGSGCVLVSRKALEAVEFRDNKQGGFDDVLFCFDLQDKGFELYADCSIICEHLTDRPWNWTRIGNKTEIVYK